MNTGAPQGRTEEVHFRAAGSGRETRALRGWSTLPVTLGPAGSMAAVDG
nr:hypothetical protein [Mycobacterium sp. 1465703.0]